MPRKVFVSHKKEDSGTASKVAERIKTNGIATYLDVIDDALASDGPELADHIRKRMSECDQLVAVLSTATKDSWWVPWEIGVASEKDFRIASYAEQYISLPSYLQKWPVLQTMSEVDLYCEYSKRNEQVTVRKMDEAYSADRKSTIFKSGIGDFHKELARALVTKRRGY
ncbi:toll/interleukin-1 receptor domain-containing protein (plasmid) [Rhizobium bangladeshense]|uniref:TIR domain-containing protein n=1 Tax=Rhizobium fabae TaxID=573179 RepID=A0A7W6FL76_9HYPH|nr:MULTISPECIES: toll/interleukin-1 receptor domain-containing protein [Rhizobium]MBB3918108.1 hypothetical protein [Rhizobium fabae]MBX5139186.1 toll/interleukin-1 receptor domain-containing protein [Rhizobium lentis]MBX5180410.1 toll/interleukin-1 receptor domain-containing protein [Rhizobium lentis]MBX5272553.1 toll/interleukin-1 receptor domain-containing protein [Rhizobium sp. NLR17b]MBX5299958.1 toll/interleukin-1 receptor domain-containing protein [Rhizobium sp. NLR12b]